MSIITLQFGQCGNQIGQTLYEYLYEDTQNQSSKLNNYQAESKNQWFSFNKKDEWLPRSILIDTENKVTETANTNQKRYRFENVVAKAQGGSANNWAFGYKCTSEVLLQDVMECVRKEVERSDYIVHFLNILGAAGGTGSGVGSKIIKKLHEDYSSKIIINSLVLPFKNGEVVTQNYNTLLTLSKLHKHSDATLLFENDKLHAQCSAISCRGQEINYSHINAIIVQQLAALCQPVKDFHLGNLVADLAPHPSLKFLQLRSAPHVKLENVKFESTTTWPSLIKALYKSINCDSVELRKCKLEFKCLGKMFVSRGKDVMKRDDLKAVINSKVFTSWIPDNAQYYCYHQTQQLKHSDKYLLAVLNSNIATIALENVLQDAWELFTSGAYLHHYQKFGIDETYFLKSFEKLENILHNYTKL